MKRNLIKVIAINECQGASLNSMKIEDRKKYFKNNYEPAYGDTIITNCKKYLKTLEFIRDNEDLEVWSLTNFYKKQNHWLLNQNPAEMLAIKNKLFDTIIRDVYFDDKEKEKELYFNNKLSESYREYEHLNDDWGKNVWLIGFIQDIIKDFFYDLKSGNLALNN